MKKYSESEIHSGESAVISMIPNGMGEIFIKKQLKADSDKYQRKRFLNEINILSKIKSDFLIPMLDYDTDGEFPFYIMPKADMNLKQYLQNKFGFSEIGLFEQIVQGLKILHSANILHLDLKTDNILIFNIGEGEIVAKISDLGLAMHIDEVKSAVEDGYGWHGTFPYIPYRDLKSIRNADFSSDIYNLGRILHRVLKGKECTRNSEFLTEGGYFSIIIRRAYFEDTPYYHNIDEFISDFNEAIRFEKMFNNSIKSG